jgi:hypothetical protein
MSAVATAAIASREPMAVVRLIFDALKPRATTVSTGEATALLSSSEAA